MTTVAPSPAVNLGRLLDPAISSASQDVPFAPARVAACSRWSEELMARSGGDPSLVALAFWLRRGAIVALGREFAAQQHPETLRLPRGLAFHVAPTNVPSIAAYSFALSFLAGNRSIVRISPRASAEFAPIAEALDAALSDSAHARLRPSAEFISYDRDDTLTGAISGAAQLRVFWGGDAAIAELKRQPARTECHDVTFRDRRSLAVLSARAIADMEPAARRRAAEALFNDAYWFDQRACSSPSTLVWVGTSAECAVAREQMFDELGVVIREKGFEVETGTMLGKLTAGYVAAAQAPQLRLDARSSELMSVFADGPLQDGDDDPAGFGFFREVRVQAIGEIPSLLHPRDQTVTHQGLSADEVSALALAVGSRGVDRIVPLGGALQFSRFWDGYDLLAEFTRVVHVPATR